MYNLVSQFLHFFFYIYLIPVRNFNFQSSNVFCSFFIKTWVQPYSLCSVWNRFTFGGETNLRHESCSFLCFKKRNFECLFLISCITVTASISFSTSTSLKSVLKLLSTEEFASLLVSGILGTQPCGHHTSDTYHGHRGISYSSTCPYTLDNMSATVKRQNSFNENFV